MKTNFPKLNRLGNKTTLEILAFLFFLFFIQQVTFLVESVYMMNLLHTSMDGKAFGVLLLALPVFISFLKPGKITYLIIGFVILMCLVLSPVISTSHRIIVSGLGAGLFLLYLALQISDHRLHEINWGHSAALATLTSIAFRLSGHSLDISVSGHTRFIGWLLAALCFYLLLAMFSRYHELNSVSQKEITGNKNSNWASVLGLMGSIMFIYFIFSSPGVLTRWTESNYFVVHLVLSGGIFLFVLFSSSRKCFAVYEKGLVFNVFFMLLVLGSILLHRVPFPEYTDSDSQLVGDNNLAQTLVPYLMLMFSPIVFMNIGVYVSQIHTTRPKKLTWPFLLGVLLLILCVFMLIFSNTWGYAKPISGMFRNKFHVPFLVAGVLMLLPYLSNRNKDLGPLSVIKSGKWSKYFASVLILFMAGFFLVGHMKPGSDTSGGKKELSVMTYNIQQGVDLYGNKNYEGQLQLIQEVNPDIIGLQESDGSRISGGNSDVVRYFADKLGYFSYFGPKTVSGTFGTAILSRFPLDSCRTVFSYSSQDEVGTTVANITMDSRTITLVNSHPAGNEDARKAHAEVICRLSEENRSVIAMGDYNFNQTSPFYKQVTEVLKDAWLEKYPDAIGKVLPNKLDSTYGERKRSSGILLSGDRIDMKSRIDHIFLSQEFQVIYAHYIPAPESGTDHPVHWAVIRW